MEYDGQAVSHSHDGRRGSAPGPIIHFARVATPGIEAAVA